MHTIIKPNSLGKIIIITGNIKKAIEIYWKSNKNVLQGQYFCE